jgi:hypothetical protein
MNYKIHISLDHAGFGKIELIDGEHLIDVSRFVTRTEVSCIPGDHNIVTLHLVPNELTIDLPAELRALLEDISDADDQRREV